MKRHIGFTKAQRQAEWLAAFTDAVYTADARHAGRMDWDTALHYFYSGYSVSDAAISYVANRADNGENLWGGDADTGSIYANLSGFTHRAEYFYSLVLVQ